MKPTGINPIDTHQVDLSRSQLQSPFMLGQFLESGFTGLAPTAEIIPQSSQNKTSSLSFISTTQRTSETSQGVEALASDQEKNIGPYTRDPSHASASITTNSPPSRPILSRARASSLHANKKSHSSLSWEFLCSHLGLLMASLALVVDLPLFVTLPLQLSSFSVPEQISTMTDVSTMASCTLCGLLFVWTCGVVVLSATGYVAYEIVSALDENESRDLFRRVSWRRVTSLVEAGIRSA